METYNLEIDKNDLEKIDNYRRKFHTSVLTIFFTDIESSTRLREDLGDRGYTELLEKHDSILLPVVSEYSGLHIKSIGDSILAVFSQPSDAVECAVAIQDAIFNAPLLKPFLKVRIGIDMGQIAKEQSGGIIKDIFGRFVNRAARIEGLANGGHILCSESVQDNASGWVDSSKIRWHDHGHHSVKGIKKPVNIWEPYNANITEHDNLSAKSPAPSHNVQNDTLSVEEDIYPPVKIAENQNKIIELEFFEGIWLARTVSVKYYARIVSGELLIVYSYDENARKKAHYYDIHFKDNTLFYRFEWFDKSFSGCGFFRIESENRIAGRYWLDGDLPSDVIADVTKINDTLPKVPTHVLERSEKDYFPQWVENYFKSKNSHCEKDISDLSITEMTVLNELRNKPDVKWTHSIIERSIRLNHPDFFRLNHLDFSGNIQVATDSLISKGYFELNDEKGVCVTRKAIEYYRKNPRHSKSLQVNESDNHPELKIINQPEAGGCFIAQLTINRKSIKIYLGDLTDLKTDIIATSDDNLLTMGGGTSMSVRRKGGESIFDEAQKHIPVKYGDVVVTSAGSLHSKHVFHCVVIDYDKHLYPTAEVIKKVVDTCIKKAGALELKTIAFPLFGTGAGGFSKTSALENILIQLIHNLSKDIKHIEEIIIAVFGERRGSKVVAEALKAAIRKTDIKLTANVT